MQGASAVDAVGAVSYNKNPTGDFRKYKNDKPGICDVYGKITVSQYQD